MGFGLGAQAEVLITDQGLEEQNWAERCPQTLRRLLVFALTMEDKTKALVCYLFLMAATLNVHCYLMSTCMHPHTHTHTST